MDFFHVTWAFTGLILGFYYDPEECESQYGYLAFTAAFLIGMGLVLSIRSIYLISFFIFGRKIFLYFSRRDYQDTEVRFKVEEYQKKNFIQANTSINDTQSNVIEEECCSICFCEYLEGDLIVRLPCDREKHIFHDKCIKIWLDRNDLCPLCKSNIV